MGSNLAILWKKKYPQHEVTSLDNLKRRGSELSLPRLKKQGIKFIHGDIRNPEDLEVIQGTTLLLECSAEPSVQAGYNNDPRYLTNTNTMGTLNCLEYIRKQKAAIIFLSTSRVYSIPELRNLPLVEGKTRLDIPKELSGEGWSHAGISSLFSQKAPRSLYGATKYSSELFVEEYLNMYHLQGVINRCGILAGPWQMGKVDQGVITYWISRHLFGGELSYMGFGGHGKQVRDLLHIEDLFDLICLQSEQLNNINGEIFNVGGGRDISLSLHELTTKCQQLTGKKITITSQPNTHPADIPYYITDNQYVTQKLGWSPQRGVDDILYDIYTWMKKNKEDLRPLFM